MNKEIKPANYTKINHLSRVFVPQKALSREELYFSNNSKTANVSKSFLIPNEDLLDDTSPSIARKFLNELKSTILTLQRVVKQRMTIETHNWASSGHQELHKIVREENFPIVNQVDTRLQNFEIQFLKEAAKFVGDFKSLANEADASLSKHKALELEIKCLLKTVASQDIMIIVQNESVVDTSDLQTELERTKECFEKCIIKKETEYAKLWNDWYKKNLKLLINFIWKFMGTVRFGNDHVAAILGFGQFCDSDLEVAFRRDACFVKNMEGVDLLKRDRLTNLYTINLNEMASASPICLMARLLKFKYHKEHLCPSCEQGKSKRESHPPKPVPNSRQRLHLLHMDLCGPMRIASINEKRMFDQKGKLVASSNSESQYDCSNGDDSCTSNTMEPKIKRFSNSTSLLDRLFKYVYGTVRFGNDHVAAILGFGQFCDSDLEVAFRRDACFIKNMEGVDLLKRDRSTNLYTINLNEMAFASPICLMARASSTKSWLWHQHLSHLNFDTINDLARNDLVAGLPKFKYHKEHLCPSAQEGSIWIKAITKVLSKYVLEILNKYGMESCDPVGTPMEIKDKLDPDQNGTPIDATKYRSLIGALMYLTSSRLDIVHATCLYARYKAKPTEKHLKKVKRIFCYLRGTVNTGLWYTKVSGFELTGFSYADYAGSKDTFNSTSGGAQFLAIAISCNPVQHSRTKHIAVRYHFIKEHVEKGTIELYFVKTDYQLANIFTKALPTDRFNYLVRDLGMRSLSPKELERLAKSQ
nr:hypothetical protein [Tanacetum cinerariifolium]